MEIVKPKVELWSITPGAEELIERCGRVAHQSENRTLGADPRDFIKTLIALGHESVLEHASATISILTDRGVTHELVRHRLCAYTQESTRYCRYAKGIRVTEPPFRNETCRLEWYHSCRNAEESYIRLVNWAVKPEIARSVLPTCLATQIVVTANFRQWRHMLKLRLSPQAHPQMRKIMVLVFDLLHKECPGAFQDLKVYLPSLQKENQDGSEDDKEESGKEG